MILYDPQIPASLLEFGIQIPVHDSRATKTFEVLCRDPQLGAIKNRWHRDRLTDVIGRDDLLRVHTEDYVERLYSDRLESAIVSTYELIDANGQNHRYDPSQAVLPLTDLFDRILIKAAGTLQCMRLALAHGFCFYFSGGMHHAQKDYGNGFCMINDIIIAARKLQVEGSIERIWVIDTDAHKGDGTAAIAADDPTICTLSIHMAHGWPLDQPRVLADGTANPSFIPSDVDIPMAAGDDAGYVERLGRGLGRLASMAPADLAVVVCGADPYEKDELPSAALLKLTLAQMLARDRLVYDFLEKHNVPGAFLMAGGYGEHTWRVYSQFLKWALDSRYSP